MVRATPAMSAPVVDLRSDTVTRPTAGMRVAEAEVGDDVYAEDPTVNVLAGSASEWVAVCAGVDRAAEVLPELLR